MRAEDDDRDKIGRGQLLRQEFFGGIVRAGDVVGFHRGEIEEKDEHAAVADFIADSFLDAWRAAINRNHNGLRVLRPRGVDSFDIGIREAGNLLRLAVVRYRELVFAQALDRLARAVGDLDVDADQRGFGAEHVRLRRIHSRRGLRSGGSGNDRGLARLLLLRLLLCGGRQRGESQIRGDDADQQSPRERVSHVILMRRLKS